MFIGINVTDSQMSDSHCEQQKSQSFLLIWDIVEDNPSFLSFRYIDFDQIGPLKENKTSLIIFTFCKVYLQYVINSTVGQSKSRTPQQTINCMIKNETEISKKVSLTSFTSQSQFLLLTFMLRECITKTQFFYDFTNWPPSGLETNFLMTFLTSRNKRCEM